MYMIKKLLSTLFILTLLVSVNCIVTYADSGNFEYEVNLEYKFLEYCKKQLPSNDNKYSVTIYEQISYEDMLFFTGYYGGTPIATIVHVTDWGDWYSMSGLGNANLSVVGVYVQIGEEILSLESAYDNGLVTDLTPITKLKTAFFYRIGDVNGDKNLDIKDATSLQKYLVGINNETIIPPLQNKILDMNKDKKINIRDATAIQKYLAKLEY